MRRLLLISLATLSLQAFCQQDYERAIVETKTGAKIIFSSDSNSFIIDLDTAQVNPLESESTLFMQIDKKWLLQVFTIDFQNPNKKDVNDPEVQRSFLIQYMNYEIRYFKDDLNLSVPNHEIEWGKLNGKNFLLWYFDTPEYETATKQIYLSTLCFDHFINLNIPLEPGIELEEGIHFLKDVGQSLELFDYWVDIEGIYKEVNGIN